MNNEQSAEVMANIPRDFFHSDALGALFRDFLMRYGDSIARCYWDPDEKAVPHLKLDLSIDGKCASVHLQPSAGRLKTSLTAVPGHSMGVIQLMLMLDDTPGKPVYRMELRHDLRVRFYCNEQIEAINDADYLYQMTFRLVAVAERMLSM